MVSFTLRPQQFFYGSCLLLGALTCASSGIVGRFSDVAFTGAQLSDYNDFKSISTPVLETNVAFIIVAALLLASDLIRKNAMPVWFEIVWTFVFTIVEIVDIVILADNFPTTQCHPPASSLTRRDAPTDSVIGEAAASSVPAVFAKTSQQICQNWAVIVAFLAMTVVLLTYQWVQLTFITLRHRASNPDFILFGFIPKPFTYRLKEGEGRAPEEPSSDVASVTSSSFTDEKGSTQVPKPTPVRLQFTV